MLASSVVGAKVAVVPVTAMLPAAVGLNEKVAVVTVAGSIGSLKVAVTAEESATPAAPLVGFVAVTMGGVVSGTAPVVKVHTRLLASGFPAKSLMPVVSVAVYSVMPASGAEGAKIAVAPDTVMLPATDGLIVKVPVVTVAGSTGSLKVASIAEEIDTPVA